MNSYIFLCFICGVCEGVLGFEATCPKIISRQEWGAVTPKQQLRLFRVHPVPYVVIHHSDTLSCNTTNECKLRIKKIQEENMSIMGNNLHDIRFNFLIGGDGNIYQGRDWIHRAAHVKTYNSRSIGVCLIGNFDNVSPPPLQMEALKNLLKCGVQTKKIAVDYRLIAHQQANSERNCPGKALFESIKKLPHWDSTIKT